MLNALQDPYLPNPFAPVEGDNQIAVNEASGEIGCVEAHYLIILHPDQATAIKGVCGAIPDYAIVRDKIPDWPASTRPHGTTQDYMMHVDDQGHEGMSHVFDPGCVECMRAVTDAWTAEPPPPAAMVTRREYDALHTEYSSELDHLTQDRDAYKAKCIAQQDEIAVLRKQVGVALQSKALSGGNLRGMGSVMGSADREHEASLRLQRQYPEIVRVQFEPLDYECSIRCWVQTSDGRNHFHQEHHRPNMDTIGVCEDGMGRFLRDQGYGCDAIQKLNQGLLNEKYTKMLQNINGAQCMAISPGQPPNSSYETNACQAAMAQGIGINKVWFDELAQQVCQEPVSINDFFKGSDK